ncbi:MAG: DinB family protein [Thermoanaerobaculia bacterium]
MTDREFFAQRWKEERPLFVKVLKAMPEGKLDYKPHEKSRPAGRISWGMAEEVRGLSEIVEKGESHWQLLPEPQTVAEIVKAFERNAERLSRLADSMDDTRWASPGKFIAGGQVVFGGPIRDHCWWILFDLVHHRGQLSTYLRPMGGKVPAVYGPSGDEPM